ncbi:MAG: ATP-grasp domain-containing protein [Opitutales bacterium]|nr:ATP-grasp domain-containing protein [Opitutales bacterium]
MNLASQLKSHGVNIIGTSPESIDTAEDRELFKRILDEVGLKQPENLTALNEAEACEIAEQVGFPILVRPSFVLGGRGMFIVYSMDELRGVIREAFEASPGKPVLLDKFLEDAIELDVDCISDGETTLIGGMLEHIEFAGVHSGDAAMVLPPHTLGDEMIETVRQASYRLAKALSVVGLMNIQFAIKDEQLFVLEVNPRASRTVPFVSKAIGVPLAKMAAKLMTGKTLPELGFTEEMTPKHWCIKESVFPFVRFPGTTIRLGPEMRSTGEVMGLDTDFGIAFAKTQAAAKPCLPTEGNVFLSVKDSDKPKAVELAKNLASLGFQIYSTSGTADFLKENGIETTKLFRIAEGRPNVIDLVKNGEMQMIINTPSGMIPRKDENHIRSVAYANNICIMTTLTGATAAVAGIGSLKEKDFDVRSLQSYVGKNVATV